MATQAARSAVAERLAAVDADRRTLAEAPVELDASDRRRVVEVFIRLMEGLYAHLPLKRAMYGHDPVQRLRLLQQRVDSIGIAEFHRTMATILVDLRDAHTRYLGHLSQKGLVAVLPLLVEAYDEAGKTHFIVSKLFELPGREDEFAEAGFEEGVEITHWNGVPIERAVDLYAERETGGRPDARRARALESLTIRPLRYALLPDEEWVIVTFLGKDGVSQVRLDWQEAQLRDDEPRSVDLGGLGLTAYAGDPAAEAARRAKKMLFAPDAWHASDVGPLPSVTETAGARGEDDKWITGAFQDNVAARVVKTASGVFGHLRLWSFDLRDDDGFIDEVVELLSHLPRNGLVIDLRGNPGGLIWAAERLLQIFTPRTIEPVRFSLLATELTRTMAAAPQGRRELEPWRRSLEAAVTNGEMYGRGIPITPPSRCNDRGQQYPGPVVAVVDPNTYSAGDLFAAGFVDNRVGTLVSVGDATGAGGANVWYPNNVRDALAGTGHELPALPAEISYTIAFRRAVRVGDVSGTNIEDLGIPGQIHRALTLKDLTKKNVDLLDFCGALLASEIVTDLRVKSGKTEVSIWTEGLDRIDLFVDGHPSDSVRGPFSEEPVTLAVGRSWRSLEIVGLVGDNVRQRRRVGP